MSRFRFADLPNVRDVKFVNHGSDANTPRPPGAVFVIWFGTVQPLQVGPIDIVIRTDQAV